MKYFVLRHYGGIYIDMDNVSKRRIYLVNYLPRS